MAFLQVDFFSETFGMSMNMNVILPQEIQVPNPVNGGRFPKLCRDNHSQLPSTRGKVWESEPIPSATSICGRSRHLSRVMCPEDRSFLSRQILSTSERCLFDREQREQLYCIQ